MDYGIIVDSCCDMTPQLKERLGVVSVPLVVRLGEKEFQDDESLNLGVFMAEMKACTEKAGSASPSPYLYQEAMAQSRKSFVVTLSSRLSGSYASAVVAQSAAEEENNAEMHVFDSKSASAGEVLLALKIRELIQKNISKEGIIQLVNQFIGSMKTYFVLENYDNLLKNGRLGKVKEKLIRFLNLKLVMGSDGDGSIALYAKVRGVKQMVEKLVSLIETSGKNTEGESLVISHCCNWDVASQICEIVKNKFRFKEIFIIPTGGVSSLYADDKGIVMAF